MSRSIIEDLDKFLKQIQQGMPQEQQNSIGLKNIIESVNSVDR